MLFKQKQKVIHHLNTNTLNPVIYDKESFFASEGNNKEGEWWQVTIKNTSMKFNAFRVRTYYQRSNEPHMKSFDFHAGKSEDSLQLIYHETNAKELNKPYGEKIIPLGKTYGPYNVFRITSLTTHHKDSVFAHVIRISQFDVYGSINGPILCQQKKCILNNNPLSRLMIFLFIICL